VEFFIDNNKNIVDNMDKNRYNKNKKGREGKGHTEGGLLYGTCKGYTKRAGVE
jgi:hypothetical protein